MTEVATILPVSAQGAAVDPSNDGPGQMLRSVFRLLESHRIYYCVLHGYEGYPAHIGSDVDCIVDPKISARRLQSLLHDECPNFGARLVRCRGRHFVLAGSNSDGTHCFLALDIDVEAGLGGVTFYTGVEMLSGRRRHSEFWIPAIEMEFGAYLARCIARQRLDAARTRRLEALFRQDPSGCQKQISRLLPSSAAATVCAALQSSRWDLVAANLQKIRRQLRLRAAARFPLRFGREKLHSLAQYAAKVLRPDGVSMVVLGPDGAGKSSSTDALCGGALIPTFDRSWCQGFAPPLHRLLGRNHGPSSEPHALPARSSFLSLLRLGYWLSYSYFDRLRLYVTLARGTLVLYDRHVLDALVDQKRYRYGGPLSPLRAACRLLPKPDLLIVLDAPAGLIQVRKQEVPVEVTARQGEAYLALARSVPFGHVIDASRPLDEVITQMHEVILQFLEARISRRLGLSTKRVDAPYGAVRAGMTTQL